jgi:hypothetical protein
MKTNPKPAPTLKKSCWICAYQQIGGPAFLGMCTYFSARLDQPNKAIPAYQVDKGCKYWEVRPAKPG